jgi:AsmA protein
MRIIRIFAIAVAALLLIAVAAVFLIDANRFRPALETELSAVLGRQVKIADLKVSLIHGGVSADGLFVADDPKFGHDPFVSAKSLQIGVEFWPFVFSRKLIVTDLTITEPQITLLETDAGVWNFSSIGGKPKPGEPPPAPKPPSTEDLNLSVKLIKISVGRFTLRHVGHEAKPIVLDNVAVEVRDFAPGVAFPFSFSANLGGGGQIKLDGKAGPIDTADTAMTPVAANLSLTQVDVVSSGLVDPSTGFAGVVSFNGKAQSNGRLVNTDGRLRVEKLRLVKTGTPAGRPFELDFAVAHDLHKRSGTIRRGDFHFGGAPASLTGDYSLAGEIPVVHLNFSGPKMPVTELAAFLPAMDIVLPAGASLQSGTLSAKVTAQGPADRLVASGSVGLADTRLAGFNLGGKMATIEKFAGIKAGPDTDIQTLNANFTYGPEGQAIQDLLLIVAGIGQLTGAGTVSPTHALDFKMRATVHTSGALLTAIGERDASVPFFVTGTASEPVFRPDVKEIVKEKVETVEKFAGSAIDKVAGEGSGIGKAATGLLKGLLGGKKKE